MKNILVISMLLLSIYGIGQNLNPTLESVTYKELSSFPSIKTGRVFMYNDSLWFDTGLTFINLSKTSGGGSLTWPTTAGLANYSGSSTWGTSIPLTRIDSTWRMITINDSIKAETAKIYMSSFSIRRFDGSDYFPGMYTINALGSGGSTTPFLIFRNGIDSSVINHNYLEFIQSGYSTSITAGGLIAPHAELDSLTIAGTTIDTIYSWESGDMPMTAKIKIGSNNDSLALRSDGTINQYTDATRVFATGTNGYQYGKMPFNHIYRATDLTISATQNIWYKITGFTSKYSEGLTVAGDSVHVTTIGYYAVDYTITMSGLNNEVWEFATFKNGVIEIPRQQRYTSSSDVGNGSAPTTFYCDGDDWISFRIRNTTDNDDPTIKYFSAVITPIYLVP